MSAPTFPLADRPWVVARTREDRTIVVSLRDLFRQSREIVEIVGDLPTQGFAVLRLALAVLARAVDGPPTRADWRRLRSAETPPLDEIERYLDSVTDRLDLFDPHAPFFQVADLHTARDEFSGLEKLIADVPAGHPYFTTRLGRGLTAIGAAEAARWVVHAQAFDVSGIKSGAVGDDRVTGGKGYPIGLAWTGNLGGVFVEGENLWETLLLNTIPRDRKLLLDRNDLDRPAWESEPLGAAEADDVDRRPYGPLDLFTWQSRRVRLRFQDDGTVTGVVIANGDRLTPALRDRQEPMSCWRLSSNQAKKLGVDVAYMPQEHRADRALWRGLSTLLPQLSPNGYGAGGEKHKTAAVVEWAGEVLEPGELVTLRAVGMVYGSNNSVVDDIVDDRLVFRAALLERDRPELAEAAQSAVAGAEDAVRALQNLAANLTRAAGGTDERLVVGARDRASERAYAALDAPFRAWLRELGAASDVDVTRVAWHEQARRIVRGIGLDLVTAAGPDAWVGREHNGRRITSPEAEAWFQAAVNKALPVPRAPRHTEPQERSA